MASYVNLDAYIHDVEEDGEPIPEDSFGVPNEDAAEGTSSSVEGDAVDPLADSLDTSVTSGHDVESEANVCVD